MKNRSLGAHEYFDVDGGKVWFIPYFYNFLCSYDLHNGGICLEAILPETSLTGADPDRYINLKKNGNIVVVVPSYGKNICLLNLETKDNSIINIDAKIPREKYHDVICIDNKLILLPDNATETYEIELCNENNKVIKYEERFNGFLASIYRDDDIYAVKKDQFLYKRSRDTNYERYLINDKAICVDIDYLDDNTYVILDSNGYIYLFCPKDKSIKTLINSDISYHSIKVGGGKIYAFPNENGLFFDIFEIGKNKKRYYIDSVVNTEWTAQSFSRAIYNDKKIYVMNLMINSIIEIDTVNDEVNTYIIDFSDLSELEKVELMKNDIEKGNTIENDDLGIDLNSFISFI